MKMHTGILYLTNAQCIFPRVFSNNDGGVSHFKDGSPMDF